MTTRPNDTFTRAGQTRPSLLPFDPAQLTAVRVRPVEFAKMCGVSRQAVSKWIKKGLFTVGPDGRFDPAIAWREVFNNSDPSRLRARVFRDATAPVATLREKIRALEAQIAEMREAERKRELYFAHVDEVGDLVDAIVIWLSNEPCFAERLDDFAEWVDERSEPVVFRSMTPADSRETSPQDETPEAEITHQEPEA